MRGVVNLLICLACLGFTISAADAGPLGLFRPSAGSGDCPNCPDGTCPNVVEATVTVEVAAPAQPQASKAKPKVPTIDEAARELAKGGVSRAREKVLAEIIDAPAKAKALAGHYGPGTCGMLGCLIHPEEWIEGGKETQEELDARTTSWSDEGSVGPVRRFLGRRWR